MKLNEQLDDSLRQWLNERDVTIRFPRSRMVQLDGVSVGEGFSKPFTNLLLRRLDNEAGRWDVYVDEDFYYVGNDPERRGWFCGQRASRWSRLQLARPVSGDVNGAIVQALDLVESPVLKDVAEPVVKQLLETPSAHATQPDTECPLDRGRSSAPPIKLTDQQLDTVERIAETVCRRMPPTCPLLLGNPAPARVLWLKPPQQRFANEESCGV